MFDASDDDLQGVLGTLVHDLRNLRGTLMLELDSARLAVCSVRGHGRTSLESILQNLARASNQCSSLEDLAELARGLLHPGVSASPLSKPTSRGTENLEALRVVEDTRRVLLECAGRLAGEPASEEVSVSLAVRLLACVRELEAVAPGLSAGSASPAPRPHTSSV